MINLRFSLQHLGSPATDVILKVNGFGFAVITRRGLDVVEMGRGWWAERGLAEGAPGKVKVWSELEGGESGHFPNRFSWNFQYPAIDQPVARLVWRVRRGDTSAVLVVLRPSGVSAAGLLEVNHHGIRLWTGCHGAVPDLPLDDMGSLVVV